MFITGHNLTLLFVALEHFANSLPHALSAAFPAISRAAGALLVTAIWQGAIVAACLALSLRLASRISAGLRFTLWIAGFLAVAGLPFLALILRTAAPPAGAQLAAAPRLSLDARWSVAICLLWLAVSLYRALDLAAHSLRLRQLWTSATPVDDLAVPARLRGRRAIQVCTTDALDRPSVIGFLAPRILIPAWLLPRLTPGELDQILLHETEHLRRGDDWTNLLQKLSLILFPLNPILLWMERRLCLEREMACDEAVIRVTGAPRAYAACLATLAERGLEYRARPSEALSLGAWRRRPELVHRIHSLLRVQPALGPWGARGLAAALVCGLAFGSVELAHCPQLVAFVPSHATEAAPVASQSPQPSGGARAILTAYRQPASPSSGQAHMTDLRATASGRTTEPTYSDAWLTAAPRSSALSLARQPGPRMMENRAPRPIPLSAGAAQTGPAAGQSWIVLTTWEEVTVPGGPQSTAAGPAEKPAAEPAEPADASSDAAAAPDREQPSRQIQVTRVVFRVIPADLRSSLPTAFRTRDGWLVIQM